MKLLLKLLGGLAVLVLVLVLVAFLLPRHYRVERATVIRAPIAKVYPQLADLRAWRNWGVWFERDPGMKVSYSDAVATVGAWSAWESPKEGNGKATLTAVAPDRLVYRLEFPDFGMKSEGTFVLEPQGDAAVRVVWSDAGDLGLNPMSRWMGLFFDGMLGPDFEAGLAKLRRVTEG